MAARNGSVPSESLRADARRNRARVLLAARDVFVEQGADAPLDEVARRARVGIATLYRRFPDRNALQRAVALDLLARAGDAARAAEAEESDPLRALGRYMHAALDLRISAVMPALLGHISFDDAELTRGREQNLAPVLRLIERAQATGQLRSDVTFADVGLLLVRLSRPLPGPFPRQLDLALAHRHLDLLLAAFDPRAAALAGPLPAPALSLAELQDLRHGAIPAAGG
ncbi:MAG: helix-turn-helix transcriptional regulator [Chloroflexi bacterium]|nr:helix-turn-helix transcriptional regulator [Chloroflexota bacterium]